MIPISASDVKVGEPLAPLVKAQGHKNVVAAKVDGHIVDMHTPIMQTPHTVELLVKTDEESLAVVRHSTAHVMADAVKQLFPKALVTIGPSTENGFYYDFDYEPGFTDEDLVKIEAKMKEIIATKAPFRREPIGRSEALALFESMGEHYKREIIAGIPEDAPLSVYKHGDFVDLCRGPHIPGAGYIGGVKLMQTAGAYWRGDEKNKMLRRIYGTAFFTQGELDKYLLGLEEAKKRDHRKIGRELELFQFHPWAPASPFFFPAGALVYNTLIDFMRGVHEKHGYQEIVTPQIFDAELFKKSGHYDNYRQNMFDATPGKGAEVDEEDKREFMCKAMNCPSHFLMFGMHRHSYRDLPLRYADFGRLHRFERSGVTAGLVRVRTFVQDDSHIFCTVDQLPSELKNFIDLCGDVYKVFGITEWSVQLSTRPKQSMGTDELWKSAEDTLSSALQSYGLPFKINPGDGAFYGPKVEFHIKDALGRSWQLGTVQVDIANPENFELAYIDSDNTQKRPVILHRAILGSLERFLGVYLEHTAGNLPAWLAPEQVRVISITNEEQAYGKQLLEKLKTLGMRATLDDGKDKLGAKIRQAQLLKIPFALVLGRREAAEGTVAIRRRGGEDMGVLPLEEAVALLTKETNRPQV